MNKIAPIQEFEFQFNEKGLVNPQKTKEAIAKMIKLLDKDILPEIEKFSSPLPTIIEIEKRNVRTPEDARFLMDIENKIAEFRQKNDELINNNLFKVMDDLEGFDENYVMETVNKMVERAFESLELTALATNQKLCSITGENGIESDEDESEMEKAVASARDSFRTPIDKLMTLN